MSDQQDSGNGRRIGFFLGPIVFLLMLLLPAPEGMNPAAWKVAAVTALMAIWWITEAIPIPATSLIPIAFFPLLGVMKSAAACAPYANHLIYLFMGGFFLAVTMERWNLHRRIALHTIKTVGTSPGRMILGFMIATGFLSMWVSNTATTMMMVPIGLAVIQQATGFDSKDLRACANAGPESNFGKCLMLGIAYAASMGGVGTIIGTPPNTVMVGMVDKMYGVQIGFGQWMLYGVPLATIMIGVSWWLLTRVLFPAKGLELAGGEAIIDKEIEALGPMSKEEKYIVVVGCFVAAFWLSRGFIKPLVKDFWPNFGFVHDATIGILGSLILFAIPTNFKKGEFLLDWKTAVKIPWDVILLFGGGLAIANGFSKTGLASFIASRLTMLDGMTLLMFVAIVVLITIFLTEITSNTATATLLVPIMGKCGNRHGRTSFCHHRWCLCCSFLCIHASGCDSAQRRCVRFRLCKHQTDGFSRFLAQHDRCGPDHSLSGLSASGSLGHQFKCPPRLGCYA
ncbi:anion transporter [Maridesulfovibrio salexigens DSM 2638]|uniref:Anion transporter n=1 Tax=Maridesulfovibrio salexigens (strain ATCC 14822 / DSM 2638 / NCIMB 8403 / VKM B-1763) TaxID=526222 RepID=C6BYK1_MARSD|nr:anion transporter [Maridesulfovibrio salexigens DSM 2638]